MINSAISFRLILFCALFIGFNGYALIFKIPQEELVVTNIILLNILFSAKYRNIRDLIEIPFKAKVRMDLVMFGTFIDSIFLLILLGLIYSLEPTLTQISLIYTFSNIPGFVFLIYFIAKMRLFDFKFEFLKIRWLIIESLPLFGAGFLTTLYFQFDVVLLNWFISAEEAGLYSGALRIGVPLTILPLSIVTTIFPYITKSIKTDILFTKQIIKLSFKILYAILFLGFVIVLFKPQEIITFILGEEFSEGSNTMILLFASYIFYHSAVLLQNLATILNNQKENFYYSIILVLTSLIILFFTIEQFGNVGAGISRFVSSLLGFIYLYFSIVKSNIAIKLVNSNLLIFSILMLLVGYLLSYTNLVVYLMVTPILGIILLLIVKYFEVKEIQILFKLLKEPKWMKFLIK